MDIFNTILKDYITKKSSGSFGENREGMARVLLKGLPFPLGKIFLDNLILEGGFKIHDRVIPVILCDESIQSWVKPTSSLGGVSGKDHVLNLRNSSKINEIIVILGEGSSLDKSNTTSLIPIGIGEEVSADQWVEHEMIEFILEESLKKGRQPLYQLKDIIKYVLLNFKSGDSHQGKYLDQWNLLKAISSKSENGSLTDIKALIGLVNEKEGNVDPKKSDTIFDKIADAFESAGVSRSIEEWLEKDLDEDTADALRDFRDHFTIVCDSVSAFRESPYFYYSSLSWKNPKNKWWEILTLDKWTEILDEGVDVGGACKIFVTNALYRNHKPCPIVKDEVNFRITHEEGFKEGSNLTIYRRNRKYDEIGNIPVMNHKKELNFSDGATQHRNPLFYQFSSNGYKDSSQKVISLFNYEPGVVFDIAQLEKVSVLKENRKKKKIKKKKSTNNKTWISTIVLSNSGTHEINFDWDYNRFDYDKCLHISGPSNDRKEVKLEPLLDKESGTGAATFEIDEECEIRIIFKNRDNGSLNRIKLSITITEAEPVGVNSVYDKLVLQNKKGINEKVSVYSSWNLLHQLQKWISEKPVVSFYPILLGADFKMVFHQPDWNGKALITRSELNIDCRPNKSDFCPPAGLVDTRKKIILIITEGGEGENGGQPMVEYKALHGKKIREDLKVLIENYVHQYTEWFQKDPKNASWFDVIAICDTPHGVLEPDPFAILLNPFHPVRLAWQFQSQNILFDALEKKIPCPAAGIFESSQFPDSLALPCYRSQGQFDYNVFLSIDTDSTYWSVLWNTQKFSSLKEKKLTMLFDKSLGIQIQGLDEGLSSSQVEHTLSDIFKIKAGQNSINVEVFSESSETELFNTGISNWVANNLGEDRIIKNQKQVRDLWFSSGSRNLNIYDTREKHFQPSAEELVDMTVDSGYNLKWHSNSHNGKNNNLDLTILSHLSNQSPAMIKGETTSVVFNGGVSRERIRYSTVNDQGRLSFTESRVFSELQHTDNKDDLGTSLTELVNVIEKDVEVHGFGHLNTTPQLRLVNEKLKSSDYCAISSSVVDPSAFFDSTGDNFLWDYELPAYSAKHSSQSGFYLLAKKSENIFTAVRKSLYTIPGMGTVGNDLIGNLLKEISGRGIPTLKTLASGGASANGELGMLTAMHLLQNFHRGDTSFEFFPIRQGNTCNLLIPVDPFSSQLNALYKGLGVERLRPDLLALSFCIENDDVINIKITPIEIKYRKSKMNTQQLRSALFQCQSFKLFYDKLVEQSSESSLWDIARCRLFADMISFSFATYGRRITVQREKVEWARLQSKLVAALNQKEKLQISDEGRLIVVSDYGVTDFEKVHSKIHNDVLKVSFGDAKDLLKRKNLEKFDKLGDVVGDWGLISNCNNPPEILLSIKDEEEVVEETILATPEEISTQLDANTVEIIEEAEIVEPEVEGLPTEENEGIKFEVGSHEGAISSIPYFFHPSNTNLNQLNIGIVGDLGTGKTQLIKALVYNITKLPEQNRGISPKFLIMDTKRDYDGSSEKESDKNFVSSINAKIVKPYKLPINLFDIRNSRDGHPALEKAEFFIDILKKIFGGIGPNQEDDILTAVLTSFESRGYEPYQRDYSTFKSPTLDDIFLQYGELIGTKKDSPYSIMRKLILGRYFEPDSEMTIDFKDFFSQSVVLSLGGLASNDRNLKMVMIIFLNMYREYMLRVKKEEYRNFGDYQLRKIDSYLLVDEANLIMEYELPVLEDILLKGREFGIGIILSSQYLSHFKKSGTNYIEPLLTWFVHKVPNVSTKELQALGLVHADEGLVQQIKAFDCHYCLYKGLDAPGVVIKGSPHYVLDMKDRENKNNFLN